MLVGEFPAQLAVALELTHDLIAHIHFADGFRIGAAVVVDYDHFDAVGVSIRIPETRDIEPRIKRRNEDEPEQHDPRRRYAQQADDVASHDGEHIAHGGLL